MGFMLKFTLLLRALSMRLRRLLRRTKTSMVANLHMGEEDSDEDEEHMAEVSQTVMRQDTWS